MEATELQGGLLMRRGDPTYEQDALELGYEVAIWFALATGKPVLDFLGDEIR
jgi:hypothetical protein